MALINPPAWQQAGTYPARTDRLALSALLSYPGFSTDEAFPMRIRQGVKPSYQNYQLKVRAAATPNMTVIVSGGYCIIDQHDSGGTGSYVCVNDGDVTLSVQAAGGTGQYRKDTVVASVYDAEYAGTASEWRLEIIKGPNATSAGAAVRGSLPPNAQILADIAIGPNQTSIAAGNITDIRQYAVASGGIIPVASNSALTRPHPGQMQYLTDLDRFRYGKSDGSVGDIYPGLNYQQGTVSLTWSSTTAGQWVQTAVTYPTPFPSAPIVHLTPQANAPAVGGSTSMMFQVTAVTTTGFTACAFRSTAFTNQIFGWTAFL